ncbi:MAG: ParB/RepB/Spo0J family partition protein [Legionella sp.]|nr:ParB/RepB/Spo0J family partition protein [Legionella sp.]
MSAKRAGLGRNLSALLQQADEGHQTTNTQNLLMLPIKTLQPGVYQPRGVMDETALQALASSIKQQGVLQPIVVRLCKKNDKENSEQYEIIAGERRWRASQIAELTEVPVVVRDVNDETAMALGLIENLQREALNIMDEARAMHRLNQEFELTHQDIANLLSKSRAAVSNCLRLLQLSAPVVALLEQAQLDMGHARCLLGLSEEEQVKMADLIVSRGLSVRETEAWVARLKTKEVAKKITPQDGIDTADKIFDRELKQVAAYLDANVRLKSATSGKGQLLIDFKDIKQLKQVLQRLNSNQLEAVR